MVARYKSGQFANLPNFALVQLGGSYANPFWVAPLPHCILDITALRSYEKVVGSNASGVIAGMANLKVARNRRMIVNFPRIPMRRNRMASTFLK